MASVLGIAGLDWLALFADLKPPRQETLEWLSEILDRYMRSPAFLSMIRSGLQLASRAPWVALPVRNSEREPAHDSRL